MFLGSDTSSSTFETSQCFGFLKKYISNQQSHKVDNIFPIFMENYVFKRLSVWVAQGGAEAKIGTNNSSSQYLLGTHISNIYILSCVLVNQTSIQQLSISYLITMGTTSIQYVIGICIVSSNKGVARQYGLDMLIVRSRV